mmetsp:Transcript_9600/g.28662  ORF Transcript_9600/g.28662 Transcript_9600/m.28662 type:complete len:568 (-) Transcript_9600:1224-2927(-)|eukprot:CAMPEP_0172371014 /NCGR_PEP_ID=MMETSP1060-20121228/40818_1 /TAXON_ID=37318 /ORGANISM="Pseudo-nitzschia pungens, Strain cf. cingulata" /LENGTH=567 /DNA_ID=CAMNT_0013096503 /DNA_START=244 /DNA_END=1947 /DNA_ORIENTATION=+
MSSSKKSTKDISFYKKEIKKEKAGKRKLYLSLVKLAEELKRTRKDTGGLEAHAEYRNQRWYEGGLWRAPQVLPEIRRNVTETQRTRQRDAISLSDMFLNLVIVTGFTRVGLAITNDRGVQLQHVLYFAVFWTIWEKETSYGTRFDTTDLSAQLKTLLTCFAVLFASLSVPLPMSSDGGIRIMIMAAFCASTNLSLMVRVLWWYLDAQRENSVEYNVKQYAAFNVIMNFAEAATWIIGILFVDPSNRWIVFLVGVFMALRVPRFILSNDFHAANSQRGVLYILLLGFMLQSVVVVATDFFEYENPDWRQYSFIGSACLLLFSIKILYCDDASTLASDHALLVNRTAAAFFNVGQFALLFSTTILGSGLNLLTHHYLAATAALPGNDKAVVCGGFAAVLLSMVFTKSMHIRRVPVEPSQRALFVGAYVLQILASISVAVMAVLMIYGRAGYLQVLVQTDLYLMWVLCGFAVLLVLLGWIDEGLELALQGDGDDDEPAKGSFLVSPFGFWWCLHPEVTPEEILAEEVATANASHTLTASQRNRSSGVRLSEFSPLLGESVAQMRIDMGDV